MKIYRVSVRDDRVVTNSLVNLFKIFTLMCVDDMIIIANHLQNSDETLGKFILTFLIQV